jgi:hypothetical protein
MTTKMLESETIMPGEDEFMGARRYKVTYQCEKCNHIYHRTFKAVPAKDPPCPNKSCAEVSEIEQLKKQVENLTRMLESQTPPAHIGQKPVVKAVDTTAKIVMEDYSLTNLKDNIRTGETMAPKLPPAQQAAADGYFGGSALKAAGINKKQMDLLGRRAMSGAFRGMSVAPSQIMPAMPQGASPLRVVRTESTGRKSSG